MVPPWADDIDDAADTPGEDPPEPDDKPGSEPPMPIAPPARFRDARRGLGGFVRSGDNRDLRRALGHYVRSGYGGSVTMTRRLGGTASTAGRLNGVLESGLGPDGTALQDVVLASGNDVNVVMDAVVDAARPGDGTQDSESSRRAVRDALSDLLDRFPGADLLALTDSQREFVIERYAALDVYGRFCLDLQKTIMNKASDAATGLRRLKQVRAFITEQVSAAFKAIRDRGAPATTANVASLTKQALRETLGVFEEYLT
jgi:hypothetical protein